MTNKVYKGIGSSEGISIAKVFILKEEKIVIVDAKAKDPKAEIAKYESAMAKTKDDLVKLKATTLEKLGAEKAEIFEAHLSILEDPAIGEGILSLINDSQYSASKAIHEVTGNFVTMFEAMDDDYFRERAADVKDIAERLLKHALGLKIVDLAAIDEEVVIVAEDLTPSQTAQLNPKLVKGFACNVGGRTSHAAIMARSLEIPAVLGLKDILSSVKENDIVAMDGLTGEIEINPKDKKVWETKAKEFAAQQQELKKFINAPTVTKDGFKDFILAANIGSPNDVENVLSHGGEAIGLFRSEFLYMDNSNWPTEEEQFTSYKKVVELMNGKPTIIRTLDIGGDKKLSYFEFPHEDNPFLGYRAIRFTMDRKEIFRVQLRALLRASAFGPLGIMFPMIATVDEFRAAKEFTLECKAELEKEGVKVGKDLEIGMMIEIPAAAVIADKFAKYADFFSVGTNDLIQYTMAADRMSEKVSYLYQPYLPSILNLLKLTIDGAHKHGKWVGMCGEMAGEPNAVPLLMGLGLDEFSMSATSIPRARSIMSKLTLKETQELAAKALECETSEEVLNLVRKTIK